MNHVGETMKGCQDELEEDSANCKVKDAMPCNLTGHYLAEHYPGFMDCICKEDTSCNIKRMFGKQCALKEEPLKPSTKSIQSSFIQQAEYNVTPDAERGNDCGVARQVCQQSHHCYTVYENFKRLCSAKLEYCDLQTSGPPCLIAWNELSKTVLGNCKCPDPGHEHCLKIWKTVFSNNCLMHIQASHAYTTDKYDEWKILDRDTYDTNIDLKLELDTPSKQDYKGPRSCLDATMLCVSDSMCNKQLAPRIKACTLTGDQCDMQQCQVAIRAFYENIPFNVAQILALCDCDQSDITCQQAKENLHSTPCAVNVDPSPPCLNVIHSCLMDTFCREKFETFQLKCWGHEINCQNDESCLYNVRKEDFTCLGNDACRAAYIGILGTILQVQCTCSTVPASDRYICELFHYMLHGTSCFNQATIPIPKIFPSLKGTSGKEVTLSGFPSFFNGAVIYIMAYTSGIILIFGIILLAILKIRNRRTSSQTRNLEQVLTSESLMVH
ncbi:GDNF family receptor alpha-like [Microcaecilia unicolor]|uniref:GDNF family receptor alpha-like n=1 Tax=Microcaecilia unicolor TaxID=1415580 RepID=A0A6P7XEV8_9AMPH|nr:GDNF family receptor alpha-like [Microcaecilia unicolor]